MAYSDALNSKLKELATLLTKKRNDYGTENLAAFGEFGIMVRVTDKVSRLKNLMEHAAFQQVSDENTRDTWMDLAGYAISALMIRDGEWEDVKQAPVLSKWDTIQKGICPLCGRNTLEVTKRDHSWTLRCKQCFQFVVFPDALVAELQTDEALGTYLYNAFVSGV